MSYVRMYFRHNVADYDSWKKGYDAFSSYQKNHGVFYESVYQSTDDPNNVTVIHDFHSIEEAKAFAQSEELKRRMSSLGVKGTPQIWYATESKKS